MASGTLCNYEHKLIFRLKLEGGFQAVAANQSYLNAEHGSLQFYDIKHNIHEL
jgi:hypothetical protein